MMMIRWKAPVFVITSIFLLCCELYGWTSSDEASHDGVSVKQRDQNEKEKENDNFFREEDFPTLKEWLEDREVLYKERSRYTNHDMFMFINMIL